MEKSRAILAMGAIVKITVAAFVIYAGITYPRAAANTYVSFTVAPTRKQ